MADLVDLFQDYAPPNAADYNPDAQISPKLWPRATLVWSIAYNTELVKDPPKSWMDLTKPQYDKMTGQVFAQSGGTTWTRIMFERQVLGEDYWQKQAATNPVLYPSGAPMSDAMVRAAKDLGTMLYVLSKSKNFDIAKRAGIPVCGEVFADRGYSDDGTLAPRDKPGGMIEDAGSAVKQALAMIEEGYVTSLSGKRVPVAADTLCIHGDQPNAVLFAKTLRTAFAEKGVTVAAP